MKKAIREQIRNKFGGRCAYCGQELLVIKRGCNEHIWSGLRS